MDHHPQPPAGLHPEIYAAFERERLKTRAIATAQANTHATRTTAFQVLDKMAARGEQLDVAEERADELEHASRAFENDTRAANRGFIMRWLSHYASCACLPAWWFEPSADTTVAKKNVGRQEGQKYR